jgi:Skp family chaperone for outer membrane proteins
MRTITVIGLGFAVLAPASASAQAVVVPPDARVAYVSSQRLSRDSALGKAGTARIQAMQQQRQSEIRARQQTLEATRQQMLKATTPEERARLGSQEVTQRIELERSTMQAQQDLQNLQQEISADLRPKVIAAINEVLKGTRVEVVANLETAIVWALPGLDLTTAVIERMDAAVAATPAAATPTVPAPASPVPAAPSTPVPAVPRP